MGKIMERYTRKFKESTSLKDIFTDFGLNISDAKKQIKDKADIYLFDTDILKYKKVHDLVKKINKLPNVSYTQVDPDIAKITINYKK